ncbi:M24 family metallopeptidase [Pseudonocardia oroxyli]|uniref:Xaa-Pro dipeptidase n=1 Tax=Pseudonocardia oroxyli TaxID=366584 RepID=A0A1G7SPV6_PSEOR|nr:Xaa-Pro peptidase family protein [Pseudonocardia oroxyli]SDG24844.1 Xaa-Pro dipeptidase [Pseudonocardia oroxyli]
MTEVLATRTDVLGLSFPADEYQRRYDALVAELDRAGASALVVTRPENIFYVTGYRAAHIAARTCELHAAIIVPGRHPVIFARSLERQTVTAQWATPVLFADHEDPFAMLPEILAGVDITRLGVEERFLRLRQDQGMRRVLPGVGYVDLSGLVERVASVSSPVEIEAMRQASVITEVGLAAGLDAVRRGDHAYEAVAAAHDAMYRAGQTDFDKSLVAVWSGPEGGRMHDTAVTQRFVEGDLATVEIMGVHRHYRTGGQASVHVGEDVPGAVRDAHALVIEMHERARAAIRAGVTAGEVFAAASGAYREVKGEDYYRRVGGSMGLTNFTLDLVRDRRDVLLEGTPILIQTLVDDPVLIACASTVLVEASGSSRLTSPVLTLRSTP